MPLTLIFGWDYTWFGIIVIMTVAIGHYTPPLAINLMVAAQIAETSIEATSMWAIWFVIAMLAALSIVVIVPEVATWLPRALGY